MKRHHTVLGSAQRVSAVGVRARAVLPRRFQMANKKSTPPSAKKTPKTTAAKTTAKIKKLNVDDLNDSMKAGRAVYVDSSEIACKKDPTLTGC
jgi:hypothetical protein